MRIAVFTAAAVIVTAMIACAQGSDPNATGDTTGGDGTDTDGGGNIPPDGYDGGVSTSNDGSGQTGMDSGSSKEGGTSSGKEGGAGGTDSGSTTPGMGDCVGNDSMTTGGTYDDYCDTFYTTYKGILDSQCSPGGNECAAMNGVLTYCCYLSPPGSKCNSDFGHPECVPQ